MWVKQQVSWPQNFILGGPNKGRVNYDSLSIYQWISGFCQIVKEELNSDTKIAMLDCISDLMDDAQDFGWNPAKASHAVLLCRMEEGKVTWQDMAKIDRIRRSHAQRSSNSHSGPSLASKIKNSPVHKKATIQLGGRITNTYVPFVMHTAEK